MRKLGWLICGLTLALVCQSAEAVRVTGVSAASGLGSVFALNSASVVTNTENNITPGPGGTANEINLDITVLQKHIPFSFDLAIEETVAPTGSHATSYVVNLTLRNGVIQSQFGNPAINGFDVTTSGSVFPLFSGLGGPFVSDTFAIEADPEVASGVIRFGGLSGGGGQLDATGDVSVSSFNYIVTSFGIDSDVHTMTFTANPEPTTLLLGGLALVPAGVVARRRRRAAEAA